MSRREVANPDRWQAIVAVKAGPCRVCCDPCSNGALFSRVRFRHVVARDHGGDDLPENIVPVCEPCDDRVTLHCWSEVESFLEGLSDAEYAYMVERGGADYAERAYGVRYAR